MDNSYVRSINNCVANNYVANDYANLPRISTCDKPDSIMLQTLCKISHLWLRGETQN